MEQKMKLEGHYHFECFDKDGNLKWVEDILNSIVTVGLNYLLDTGLRNQSVIATWYMGLVTNASWTAFAAGDTMGSHAGWLESGTSAGDAYDETVRQTWTPSAAAGGVITNTSTVNFTMNASITLKGAFLTSSNTKGGTSGTLFSTGAFASTQAVVDNDVVRVTYTITATPV